MQFIKFIINLLHFNLLFIEDLILWNKMEIKSGKDAW